jgi:dihydrofolate reductase
MMDIVFVVAVAENGVIGVDGRLPWRLKSDLRHFRTLTMGHPVLMGRKTCLSIGKPLPGRTNIVLTRDPAFAAAGVLTATSLPAALAAARGDALRRGVGAIMVVGGADLYAQLMPMATRVELTRVHTSPEGDAFFAALDPALWRETQRSEHAAGAGDDAAFTISTYRRIDGAVPGRGAAVR